MRAQVAENSRGYWLCCRALPGFTRVRSPFRPARRRALTSEARGRIEVALQSFAPGAVSVREWVNPDCRGVPHLTEVVVGSRHGLRCVYLHTAAEKLDVTELVRLLQAGAVGHWAG